MRAGFAGALGLALFAAVGNARAEHRVGLDHRHVLVRRGVEHQVGTRAREQGVERRLVGEVEQHGLDRQRRVVVAQPGLDAVQVRFALVEQEQALGRAAGDLAAELGADAAAGAGDEHGLAVDHPGQDGRIEVARRWVGDRLRTCKFQKIVDPAAGPLIAIREFIISRKSMGGLQTDLDCRVLDEAGAPIPGLYAAGESAGFGGGGMNGKRGLEGTFLGGCLLGGRIAGRVA